MKNLGKIPQGNNAQEMYNRLPVGTKTSAYEAKRTLEALKTVSLIPSLLRRNQNE